MCCKGRCVTRCVAIHLRSPMSTPVTPFRPVFCTVDAPVIRFSPRTCRTVHTGCETALAVPTAQKGLKGVCASYYTDTVPDGMLAPSETCLQNPGQPYGCCVGAVVSKAADGRMTCNDQPPGDLSLEQCPSRSYALTCTTAHAICSNAHRVGAQQTAAQNSKMRRQRHCRGRIIPCPAAPCCGNNSHSVLPQQQSMCTCCRISMLFMNCNIASQCCLCTAAPPELYTTRLWLWHQLTQCVAATAKHVHVLPHRIAVHGTQHRPSILLCTAAPPELCTARCHSSLLGCRFLLLTGVLQHRRISSRLRALCSRPLPVPIFHSRSWSSKPCAAASQCPS